MPCLPRSAKEPPSRGSAGQSAGGRIATFIVVTVLVTVGFQPLNAAVFRGSGSTSCGSWTEAKGTERYDRESWVMGFLSGYNAYATTGDADIAEGVSAPDIFKWLDN